MNNTTIHVEDAPSPDVLTLIKKHGPEILSCLKNRQKERGVSNADIIKLAGIPQSTFYRFWNGNGTNLDHDNVARICLFLGVSVDDFRRDPTDTSKAKLDIPEISHEDVMTNIHAELNKQRETIDTLNANIAALEAKNTSLEAMLKEKTDEIILLHSSYAEKIGKLTDALLERHEHMHNLNVTHNARVDHLNTELSKRFDQMHSLFTQLLQKNPETVQKIIKDLAE